MTSPRASFEIPPPVSAASASASSASDRLSAEAHLLGSLPSHIGAGIADSASELWDHKARTVVEAVSGIALGAAFSLLSRNPNPLITSATLWAGRGLIGVAAADLGLRFGRPMVDVWNHPKNLTTDEKVLGDNVGDAVLNYGLAFGEGAAGASLGGAYLARTNVGSFLQGYTEKNVDASVVKDIAGIGSTGPFNPKLQTEGGELSGNYKLRTFSDGSQVALNNKSLIVATTDGASMAFNRQQSLFGLKNSLQLERVHHATVPADGSVQLPDMHLLRGRIVDSAQTAGQAVPDGLKNVYDFNDGMKLITNAKEKVVEVDTPGLRLLSQGRGKWTFNQLAGAEPHTFAPRMPGSSSSASSGMATKIDLGGFSSNARSYEKSFEAALAQFMVERAADIGSGTLEHTLITHLQDQNNS